MKQKLEAAFSKLPVLGKKGMLMAGVLMLSLGLGSAAIVNILAPALFSNGTVDAPFLTQITAASVGTLTTPQLLEGANTVAGSAPETMDTEIVNNANQDIQAFLEVSFGSTDDSLTTDYVNVEFDGTAAQHMCNVGNRAYYYRTFNKEAFVGGATETPQVSYEFPITATGYFVGDYDAATNIVVAKAC